MVKKIYNIKFLVFLVLVILFSIGYPIYYHFYSKPKKFKQELFEAIKVDNSFNASDNQISNFTDCLTQQLIKKYKIVNNIPPWKDYSTEEKKIALNCIIDNLLTDSINKKFFREKLDSIMYVMWK